MTGTYIAHRGLSALAPENTLAAFRLAAQKGFTWIETDVDLAACGTAVLLHDTDLDRTTNLTGSLYLRTAQELAQADAGSWFAPQFSGEHVPTLAELIDLMNELELNANIELKSNEQGATRSYELIEAVIAELSRLAPQRRVLISSFNHLLLAEFKRRAPGYEVAALMSRDTIGPDWLSVLELTGASAVHPESQGLTRGQVQAFCAAGYEVNVWTVNSRDRANELFNWGANAVFTDCVLKA